jgi:DNA-binding MarR family transcriptional regulator
MASDLRLAVHRLTRRLRQERPSDGLTLTQLSALATIWREGPLTAGDLAVREGVKPPSITRVLIALEDEDLVVREEHPDDARQVLVTATDLGAAVIEADFRARDAWLAQELAGLTTRERSVLARAVVLLERLASA